MYEYNINGRYNLTVTTEERTVATLIADHDCYHWEVRLHSDGAAPSPVEKARRMFYNSEAAHRYANDVSRELTQAITDADTINVLIASHK